MVIIRQQSLIVSTVSWKGALLSSSRDLQTERDSLLMEIETEGDSLKKISLTIEWKKIHRSRFGESSASLREGECFDGVSRRCLVYEIGY